jgi:hypothetical protein
LPEQDPIFARIFAQRGEDLLRELCCSRAMPGVRFELLQHEPTIYPTRGRCPELVVQREAALGMRARLGVAF